MDLPFQRLHADAQLPDVAHPGDAGLDLRSVVDVEVGPGERVLLPTGLAVAIPEGHAGLVLPRSGLASKHGLTLANAPGLIDAGYRGEVTVAMVNLDRTEPVAIAKGDRVAQLVIVEVGEVHPTWAEGLAPSRRGADGFGSTGTA
ncbi:MAG TPA: dUTP diphosphatase [Actinomycetota bacterium]|jgi:dUTP pyrophosphatase